MSTSAKSGLATMPSVNVTAMATIVKELLAGGVFRLNDQAWLQDRAAMARLSATECAALEALRVRLQAGGATVLKAVAKAAW